jgi:hypothetical protein
MSQISKLFTVLSAGILLAGCVASDGGKSLPRGGGGFTATPPEDGWTRIGPFSTLNKNCEVIAVARIRILEQPKTGRIRLITARGSPGYSSDSAHAHCNSSKVAGPFVEYRPKSGFRGTDRFIFEVRFKDGERRVFTPMMNVGVN